MELFTLDSNFQPKAAVENFESAIWTERYSSAGDFEIITTDIAGALALMPRESYLGVRDSNVPMIIENHKITKPIRDKPAISITGRSFESVLERRASVNQLSSVALRTAWTVAATKESDAAFLAMRVVLGDAAQYQGMTMVTSPVSAVRAEDAIPEIKLILPADFQPVQGIADWIPSHTYSPGDKVLRGGYVWQSTATTSVDPLVQVTPIWTQLYAGRNYDVKAQNLYTTVLDFINTNRRGIKSYRSTTGGTQASIEIYNGADLTGTYVVDARLDQIDEATYLLSNQGSTNVAYVYGINSAQLVKKNTAPEPTGLARRVLVVDDSTDNTTTNPDITQPSDVLTTRGLIELYKYNATALFEGQIAQQVAIDYNTKYFLGDILKLVGEFGISQNVRVIEFIRSSDSSGFKSYPTFEAVDG